MTAYLRLFLATASIVSLSACSAFKSTSSSGNTSSSGSKGAGANSGVSSSMKMRLEIADFGAKFVGVPYKYAGQSPSTGFDCSGFTSYVLKGFGVTLSPASAAQATTGTRVPLNRAQPGDLLFFGDSESKIQHVALIVKNDKNGITCVHSTSSRGVMVENVNKSTYWEPKILFARSVL
jgi:cell wall-associated NlpC family hydrolase